MSQGYKDNSFINIAHFPQGAKESGAKPKAFTIAEVPNETGFFFKMSDDKGYIAMKMSRAEAVDAANGILKKCKYLP